MGILDQLILTLYTISLAIISFLMVVFSLAPAWVPLEQWLEQADSTGGRVTIGLIGLAFLAASVRLIVFAFTRKGRGQAVVHETAMGDIRISMDAVENLVRKVARGVKGVRDVKAVVELGPNGLVTSLTGVIGPEVSIPEVSEEIQNAVKSYVRRVVGVDVAEVRIRVENISTDGRRRLD